MEQKTKKKFYQKPWFIVLAVIVGLSVIGNVAGKKDNASTADAMSSTVNAAQPVTSQPVKTEIPKKTEEPAIVISSADLSQAFEANEIKANSVFRGKMADITGTITYIGEVFGSTSINLSDGKEFSFIGISCDFKDKGEIEKIASLNKGDTVTISGKIDGKGLNVTVQNCFFK